MIGFTFASPICSFASSAYDANLSQQSGELGQALSDMNEIDLTVHTETLSGKRMKPIANPDIPIVASLINVENYPNSPAIVKVRANLVYQIEEVASVERENIETMKNCQKAKDQACASSVMMTIFDQNSELHEKIQNLSDFDSSTKAAFNQGRAQAQSIAGACTFASETSSRASVPATAGETVNEIQAAIRAK